MPFKMLKLLLSHSYVDLFPIRPQCSVRVTVIFVVQVRSFCLQHGAALFYTSAKTGKNTQIMTKVCLPFLSKFWSGYRNLTVPRAPWFRTPFHSPGPADWSRLPVCARRMGWREKDWYYKSWWSKLFVFSSVYNSFRKIWPMWTYHWNRLGTMWRSIKSRKLWPKIRR